MKCDKRLMCECEVDVYLWTRGESLPPDTRDTRSFVKRVKRKGESTQPCGAPVLRITGLERELLTLTD